MKKPKEYERLCACGHSKKAHTSTMCISDTGKDDCDCEGFKPAKTEKLKITLTWEQCELIAGYYRFPTVIFLFNDVIMRNKFKGKKREDEVLDKIKRLERIMELSK